MKIQTKGEGWGLALWVLVSRSVQGNQHQCRLTMEYCGCMCVKMKYVWLSMVLSWAFAGGSEEAM